MMEIGGKREVIAEQVQSLRVKRLSFDRAIHVSNGRFAYAMLLAYTISFLLHIPERLPTIAIIRPDLILLGLLAFSLIGRDWTRVTSTKPGKLLLFLCVWIVLTIPFVEWPGSVIRDNWKPFLKAIIFFFAIVLTVDNKRRLGIFFSAFLSCQMIRVLEPLGLHLTQGYWGDEAHMGGGQFLNRLSGAPVDVINPNGLAFIIIILLPFLHFFLGRSKKKSLLAVYLITLPFLMYALFLTGSRSGVIGIAIVLLALLVTAKRRFTMVLVTILITTGIWMQLDLNQRDRFDSLINKEASNAATAAGRIHGLGRELIIASENPIFGHGIATSKEAIFTRQGSAYVSHNLYLEAIIEIGIPGTIIFLFFIYSSYRLLGPLSRLQQKIQDGYSNQREPWLSRAIPAVKIAFFSWAIFSMAQYGLTEYHW